MLEPHHFTYNLRLSRGRQTVEEDQGLALPMILVGSRRFRIPQSGFAMLGSNPLMQETAPGQRPRTPCTLSLQRTSCASFQQDISNVTGHNWKLQFNSSVPCRSHHGPCYEKHQSIRLHGKTCLEDTHRCPSTLIMIMSVMAIIYIPRTLSSSSSPPRSTSTSVTSSTAVRVLTTNASNIGARFLKADKNSYWFFHCGQWSIRY